MFYLFIFNFHFVFLFEIRYFFPTTKLIPTLRNKKYEDRLRETELFSMSHRRFRGDLIQVYKIFNKLDNVDLEPLLELSQTGLRSNGLKIVQLVEYFIDLYEVTSKPSVTHCE